MSETFTPDQMRVIADKLSVISASGLFADAAAMLRYAAKHLAADAELPRLAETPKDGEPCICHPEDDTGLMRLNAGCPVHGEPPASRSALREAAQRFVDAYEADLFFMGNTQLAPIMGMQPPTEEEGERIADELSRAHKALLDALQADAGGDPPAPRKTP